MAAHPPWRRTERPRAFMAEKVVAGKDVIDLEAVRAGIALADVALEETLAVHEVGPSPVAEESGCGGAPARLAGGGRVFHSVRSRG